MYDRNKEIREAITAGERALSSLQEADKMLRSAGNWGFVDILGGGLISGLLKHSRLRDANRCMEQAKRDLQIFQMELRDVVNLPDLRVELGDLLTFADFFFDGFLVDFLVQSQIRKAKDQVELAIFNVSDALRKLRNALN